MAASPVDLTALFTPTGEASPVVLTAANTGAAASVNLAPAASGRVLRPVGPASWQPSRLSVGGQNVSVGGQTILFRPPGTTPELE